MQKDLTEVKIFQKVSEGLLFLKHPVHFIQTQYQIVNDSLLMIIAEKVQLKINILVQKLLIYV